MTRGELLWALAGIAGIVLLAYGAIALAHHCHT